MIDLRRLPQLVLLAHDPILSYSVSLSTTEKFDILSRKVFLNFDSGAWDLGPPYCRAFCHLDEHYKLPISEPELETGWKFYRYEAFERHSLRHHLRYPSTLTTPDKPRGCEASRGPRKLSDTLHVVSPHQRVL